MRQFRFIFFASFLFSTHLALISYVNSSTLGQFVKANNVSIFYTLGSILSLIIMMFASRILRALGNVKFSIILLLLGAIGLLTISYSHNPYFVLPAFIIYFSLNIVVVYCFDLFIEHYSKDELTGKTRGSYLALNNIAWISMPFISGILIYKYGLQSVYAIASIIITLIATTILMSQKKFRDKNYADQNIFSFFHKIQKGHSMKDIVIVSFVLQVFYSVMIIYSPIYLHSVQNFSWKEIGTMFGIMLIAFPLIQYPAGKLADKFGEKRFLIAGILICSLSTLAFAIVPSIFSKISLLGFAGILFLTRVGAATIEVMCDTYFFKSVSDKDSGFISSYRMITPFAYIFGPIISILILNFSTYQVLFIFLGMVLLGTTYFAKKIA